jgi:predicted metal-dependent peptidase
MSDLIKHEYDLETIDAPEAGFQLYTPERQEERPFRDALGYLTFKWQFFSQLIYSGMQIGYTHQLPAPAATDSHTIFLNPPLFHEYEIEGVPEIAFVFGHEVAHRVLNHLALSVVWNKTKQVLLSSGSTLPYDHDLMNKAMDYGINPMLKTSGVGRMPKCALYDPKLSAEGMEGCVEIYEKMWKAGSGGSRTGTPKPGNSPVVKVPGGILLPDGSIILPGGKILKPGHGLGGKGFDIHILPTQQQIDKDKGKREQEIVAAGQLAERTKGTIPGALKRIIDDIVNPKVPWEKYLRTSMLRKAGPPKLDWRYRNRRLAGRQPDPLFYAKTAHIGAGTIVFVGDNSGSIGNKEINVFCGEASGIVADLNPQRFIALWCDTKITRCEELEDPHDLNDLFMKWKKDGVGGGGGTDFRPAFKKVEEMGLEPDMLVFFTDGQGDFPKAEPHYPVIWASIHKPSKYPWGEVVDIEL